MGLSFLISQEDRTNIGAEALEVLAQTYGEHFSLSTAEVEVSCMSLAEIQELNNQYRQIDEPTDVLSFPTFGSLLEIQAVPEETPVLLGSIMLCPEKVAIYKETLPQMVHHGLLHLLGFDHEEDLATWVENETKVLSRLQTRNLSIPALSTDDSL